MSENTSGYCMDSTHKTVRDITPIDGDSKVFSPAYLFTLLVKDKDICQGIPVAFMVSKSESRYDFFFFFLASASFPRRRTTLSCK